MTTDEKLLELKSKLLELLENLESAEQTVYEAGILARHGYLYGYDDELNDIRNGLGLLSGQVYGTLEHITEDLEVCDEVSHD